MKSKNPPERRYCKYCEGAFLTDYKSSKMFCDKNCIRDYNAERRVPNASRFKIFQRDGFSCAYCGMESLDGAKLHVDHIYPLSKGGDSDPNNLLTSCSRCNLEKSATIMQPEELKKFMMEAARRNQNMDKREYSTLKEDVEKLYKSREL